MADKSAPASMAIQLPGVDFAEMARELIAAKLTEAMVGADDAIVRIVAAAMGTKVNQQGVVGGYNYENKTPYVEWLAQDLIRKATEEVLRKKVETLKPQIEATIEKQLTKNAKSIAAVLAESYVKNAKSGYGLVINLTVQPRE